MTTSTSELKRDGFPGQKLLVVPRSIVRTALESPLTEQLLVTDCGYFPHAALHGRVRPHGAGQTILILCSQGGGWVELNGVRHTIQPRQALIIPRRTPHAYGADSQDPWTIWWLHMEGSSLPHLIAACGSSEQRPVIDVPGLAAGTALIGEAIDHLDRDETLPSLVAASGAAWHLLTTIAASRQQATRDDPVERIKDHLVERLSEPLSIDDLAHQVNLSPSHLTATFKKRTGYAPMQYRTLLRMQRARVLLDTTDKPIGTIANEVGYDDIAYFSRRFAILHEQSPRHYRKTGKG